MTLPDPVPRPQAPLRTPWQFGSPSEPGCLCGRFQVSGPAHGNLGDL